MSVNIGSLVIEMSANVARLQTDMNAAKGHVDRAMSDIKKAVGVAKAALGTLGIGIGIDAFIGFGRAVLGAAAEAEQASARITAVLRATGGAAGITKQELDAMADSMAASTQFDDESIRGAEAELLKFRSIQGETFKEAMKVAADYAAYSGQSIQEASAAIGKGLANVESSSKLLKGTVGELTGSEEALVKSLLESGRQAEAQQIILDKLKSSFSGTAEEMNNGINKASHSLKKSWDEFLEAFGKTGTLQNTSMILSGVVGAAIDLLTLKLSGMNDELSRAQRTATGKINGPAYESADRTAERKDKEVAMIAAANQRLAQYEEALSAKRKKSNEESAKSSAAYGKELSSLLDRLGNNGSMVSAKFYAELAMLNKEFTSGRMPLEKYSTLVETLIGKTEYAQELTRQSVEAKKAWDEANSRAAQSVEQSNAALQSEIDALALHNEEIGLTAEQLSALTLARMDNAISMADEKIAVTELTDANLDYVSGLMEQSRLLKERRGLTASGATSQFSADAAKKTQEEWKKVFSSMESVGKQAFVSIFTRDGKSAAESMGKAIQASIIDLLYELTMKKWIIQLEASMTGGGSSSGGGFLESIIGLFGGSTASTYGTIAGSEQTAMLAAQWHTGGGPGDTPAARRMLSASIFSDAPRFHTGIGPGEQAAVIRTDESVLTPGQMRQLAPAGASSGSNVTVNITNNTSEKATATETTDSRGQRRIEVVIGEMVASEMSRPGSAPNKSMRSGFGLQPMMVGR